MLLILRSGSKRLHRWAKKRAIMSPQAGFGQASELPAEAYIFDRVKKRYQATTSASVKGGMMQEARFWSMTVPSASLVLNLDTNGQMVISAVEIGCFA